MRDKLFEYLRSLVPSWPEYVVQDFLYKGFKGNANKAKDFIQNVFPEEFGIAADKVKWVNKPVHITIDVFEPNTREILEQRMGGATMTGAQNDLQRHATQKQMVAAAPSKEPVIMCQTSKGFILMEGMHRTTQSLKNWPQGYDQNAWYFRGGI